MIPSLNVTFVTLNFFFSFGLQKSRLNYSGYVGMVISCFVIAPALSYCGKQTIDKNLFLVPEKQAKWYSKIQYIQTFDMNENVRLFLNVEAK